MGGACYCLQHHLLRLCASAHVAVLYLMLVDNLEGMPGILHSLLPGPVLRSLGMYQPSMAKGLLPPLLCIVLVRPTSSGVSALLLRLQKGAGKSMMNMSLPTCTIKAQDEIILCVPFCVVACLQAPAYHL